MAASHPAVLGLYNFTVLRTECSYIKLSISQRGIINSSQSYMSQRPVTRMALLYFFVTFL
jgi:hypothetical protein